MDLFLWIHFGHSFIEYLWRDIKTGVMYVCSCLYTSVKYTWKYIVTRWMVTEAMTDFYFLNKSLEQSLLSSYFALYTNNSTACDDSAWLQCRSIQFIVRELWPLRWSGRCNKTGREEMDFVLDQLSGTFHWQRQRMSFTLSKYFGCSGLDFF